MSGAPRAVTGHHAGHDERGFVLVWFSLGIVTVFIVAAFVVDVLHGYAVVQQVQKAADAAALAGVVQMPDASAAHERATDVAADNAPVTITTDAGISPNRLAVTATRDVATFFGRFAGIDHFTVTRRATAEYDPPIRLGSPLNTFGRVDAGCPTCTGTELWASVTGPLTAKNQGDAAMAGWCDNVGMPIGSFGVATDPSIDNCPDDDDDPATTVGVNADRETTGGVSARYWIIESGRDDPLTVELFDPVFVDVNRRCDETQFAAYAANLLPAPYRPPSTGGRFSSGSASPYCTGDADTRWDAPAPIRAVTDELVYDQLVQAGGYPVRTTFALFGPDATPFNPKDNDRNADGSARVPLCTATYGGYAGIIQAIDRNGGALPGGWREWVTLCSGVSGGRGSYVLRVTTAAGTMGQNQFSISARTSGTRTDDPSVKVYAVDQMEFVNVQHPAEPFYFVRVLPSSIERRLQVSFFDIGDSAAQPGVTLTILPPSGAGPISCRATHPSGATTGATPWRSGGFPFGGSPFSQSMPGCTLANMQAADYNGEWVSVEVTIPATYTCDHTQPDGCWLRVRLSSPGGYQDANTWAARFEGAPVRIVE